MKCPSCGLSIPDGANFCSHCGNAVNLQGQVTGAQPSQPAEAETSTNYIRSGAPDLGQEQVIWDEYPSMRTAVPGIVMWIVAGAAIIVAVNLMNFGLETIVPLIISGVVAAIVVVMLARYYIRLHSIRYRLTSQRIFVTHGLFNKRTDEIELEKYKDVFVNQDFWDKIVGCGDIEVVTGDVSNPTVRIIDVVDPVAKKESIRAAARDRKSVLGITRREEL